MPASSPHTAPSAHKTRLAPSPTGALHLGNLRTFLVNDALARRSGWRVVMRIEDLDGPRIKPGSVEQTLDLLAWFGLRWDEGPTVQSHDLAPYERAVADLAARGLAYPCDLTRTEIDAAASAPHGADSGETAFPPSLRPALVPRAFDDRATNWRFALPDETVRFTDACAGAQTHTPARKIGDFPIWTKRGTPSYQLAVIVDDAAQGITHVVRGNDLLDSTARQILLGRALGLAPIREYTHLPLVIGADGKRLAKRHGDTRLLTYRERGVTAERIIGLCAFWSGVTAVREAMGLAEFCERFDLARMGQGPTVFTPEDESWLIS